MNALSRLRRQWTILGEQDPLWAILSETDKKGGGWDRTAFFKTGVAEIGEALQTAKAIGPICYGSALDFGCGVGRLTQALSIYFQHVIGVDISGSMISRAIELNQFPDRCEYVHNVAADLSILPDSSADLVYSSIALQHVVPALARNYIREFFRVARPGAPVIFQLPCRPRSMIWHTIKAGLPVGVSNVVWRLRTGSPEAMETYSMAEKKAINWVERCGGSVPRVEDDQRGPKGWQSRRYFCVRSDSKFTVAR
jgi:SAM-dependent methyltransferase